MPERQRRTSNLKGEKTLVSFPFDMETHTHSLRDHARRTNEIYSKYQKEEDEYLVMFFDCPKN